MQPWDPKRGEPESAYSVFLAYRDAGQTRSLEATAGHTGTSLVVVRRWAGCWQWEARAAAWDQYKPKEEDLKRTIKEMAERQIREAKLLQGKALERLKSLNASELSPMDAARLLSEGARMEREAQKLIVEHS